MGWKWVEDEEHSGRGFGDLVDPNRNRNPRFPRSMEEEGWRSTRRVVRSSCRTEEVEPGRFIRKCEKTEQLLRDCFGRPSEVVESKTEHTEDDVTDAVTRGLIPFDSASVDPFHFPGLRDDIEDFRHRLLNGIGGGIGDFLEAAEEMTNEFFKSLGDTSWRLRKSSNFEGEVPVDRQVKKNPPKPPKQPRESDYSEYSGQMADV